MNSNSVLITENAIEYYMPLMSDLYLVEAWGGAGGNGGGQYSDGSAAIGGNGGAGGYAQAIINVNNTQCLDLYIGTAGGGGSTVGGGGGGNGAGGGGGSTYVCFSGFPGTYTIVMAGGGGGGQCPDDGTQPGSPGQNGANGVVSGGNLTGNGNGGVGSASGFGQGGSGGTGGGGGATGNTGVNGLGGGGGGYTAGSGNGGGGGSFSCSPEIIEAGGMYSPLGQTDNPTVNGNGCIRMSPLISTINVQITIAAASGVPATAAPVFFQNNLLIGSWSTNNFTPRSTVPQQAAVSTFPAYFFGYPMQQLLQIDLFDSAFPLQYQLMVGVDGNGNITANVTNPQDTGYQFSSSVSGSDVTFTFEVAG
jgi:hypothetical protein